MANKSVLATGVAVVSLPPRWGSFEIPRPHVSVPMQRQRLHRTEIDGCYYVSYEKAAGCEALVGDFFGDHPKTHTEASVTHTFPRFCDADYVNRLYAPDHEMSLSKSPNRNELESPLRLVDHVLPGVNQAYCYWSKHASVFPLHHEDGLLFSLSWKYNGGPKIWYVVAPRDEEKLDALLRRTYSRDFQNATPP
jgi:hypothetical protein